MIHEDQVFVVVVVVIDPMRETMALSVISQPWDATMEFNAIEIHKYRRFHEWHHFILMVFEVHNTFKRDMNRFIKECAHLFHDRQPRGHLSLSFCNQFCG